MFHLKPYAVLSVGLIAAACSNPYDRQAAVPRVVSAPTYAPTYYAPTYAPVYAPSEPYVAPRVATTGVQAFRDEFGFRYDAEGNRIDRNGRIISPQSTMP